MPNIEAGKPLLGYIVCQTTSDGQFIGGVLITDAIGLPIEFRHTEPIAPSRLQRVLYGRSLDSYMSNEVVMSALLSAVELAPEIYIVGDLTYLIGANGYGPTAIWITEARNAPIIEMGKRHELSDDECVLQLGPGNGPVRVRVQDKHSESGTASPLDFATSILSRAANTMEILEPLNRVEAALNLLWETQGQPDIAIGKIAA